MVLATPATVPQSAPVFPSTGSSAHTSKWKGNNTRRQHNKKPLLICSFCKIKGHSIEACYTRQRILKNTAALTQSELSTMESPSQPSQEASTTPSLSLADDEYLKYSFYPYTLVSFSSVFMLNKCPNALKVHSYDQVIHLVELCKNWWKNYYKSNKRGYCILMF